MKAQLLGWVLLGGLVGGTLLACAEPNVSGTGAADDDVTETKGTDKKKKTTTTPRETGAQELPPAASSPAPSTPTTPDAGPSPLPDAGADAPPPPLPSPLTCSRVTSCANARLLDGVGGDGFGTTTTATGAGSEWLSVRVREDSFSEEWVGVTARVTSPLEGDYEVYVYGSDCRSLLDYGLVDYRGIATAYTEWPDSYALDDSRTVMIEVRYVGGKCQADQPWRLDVEGGVVY